jgi:hypothetical protein
LREISLTFEAIGAEFELTRQRIQQIAQGAGGKAADVCFLVGRTSQSMPWAAV